MSVPAVDPEFVLATAERLVAIPSVSGGEDEIGRATAAIARGLGLAVVEQEVEPGRRNVIATVESGRPGPTLLFNGHLDTLPPKPGWRHDPYRPRREGTRLFGAEINNMKAAVAGMIGACAALAGAREAFGGRVILSAVIGECDALGLGTTFMLENGLRAEFAINGEPTDLAVMTAHSGVTQARLAVRGRAAHVCQRKDGVDAIAGLVRLLAGLDERRLTFTPHPAFPGLPTLNVGVIAGGSLPSMLAGQAEALIDVRTVPGMTPESVADDLVRHVLRVRGEDPTVEAEVRLLERPRFVQQRPFLMDPDHPVVLAVAGAHARIVGARPAVGTLHPQVFFGTDASHLLAAGIPTAIYGPGRVEDINAVEESIAIADVVTAARVYLAAALELCAPR
jgi:acetylornithine deacetylase/succinyl-diaminopimelate desuccinylase-like protein